jgi:hypothetical protein
VTAVHGVGFGVSWQHWASLVHEAVHPAQRSPSLAKLIELPLHPKEELRRLHLASETAENGEAALAFIRRRAFRCLKCNNSKVEGQSFLPRCCLTARLVYLRHVRLPRGVMLRMLADVAHTRTHRTASMPRA